MSATPAAPAAPVLEPARQDQRLTVEVTGLSCAGCVASVERRLAAVPGVRAAAVNLSTARAEIELAPESDPAALPGTIAQALQEIGKPARRFEHRLSLGGLHCAGCVARVETALLGAGGVLRAEVNLASETAVITTLSPGSGPLIAAVEASGKSAQLVPDTEEGAQPAKTPGLWRDPAMRAALLAGLLTLPVFVLEMGAHLSPALHHWLHARLGLPLLWGIQAVLTLAVLFGPGWGIIRSGWAALARRAPEMNALVALGTGAATLYSLVALLFPAALPGAARAVYFEAACVIITLILLGRALESRAKGRAGAAIARLLDLQPAELRLMRDGQFQDRPLSEARPGDLVQLRAGEKVAVDGQVTSGESYIDEAMLTGEAEPVRKTEGAPVFAGTVNGTGTLVYRAEAVGRETLLAQITAMVEQAQNTRLPVQSLVNKIAGVFVPVVLGLAALTVLLWGLFGPDPRLSHALVAGVSVLIIACPCAMGLATPVSIMVGMGRAAELGVLFRRGAALQQMSGLRTLGFDKTGTLTEGKPALTAIDPAPGVNEDAALALAAALEEVSQHPIAHALRTEAQARGLALPDVGPVETQCGLGLFVASSSEETVRLGSARMMREHAQIEGPLPEGPEGSTPVYLSRGAELVAGFFVQDPLRPDAPEMIAQLRAMGLRLVMITGDRRSAALPLARSLQIDEVVAELMPGEKAREIERLQADGPVGFVGDGINDAPALAQADVGLAMGSGTDVAIEAADVVLMARARQPVLQALSLSRAVMRNIRQNLFWAFAYNALLIPLASGLFYPLLGQQLSPGWAAGAMALSSLSVVLNALRLRHAGHRASV